jgi:4-aminobutyrate aminotransferase-like enzyme
MGMAFRMEIVQADGYAPDRHLADKIFAEGMKGDLRGPKGKKIGLVLDVGGYYKNVFTIAPCFDITEAEMDLAIDLFDQLIKRCAKDRL